LKGLVAILYLLGLSYGVVSLALEALGVYMGKTSVYEVVQAEVTEVTKGQHSPSAGPLCFSRAFEANRLYEQGK
jgi:hypothetical protein